MLQHIQHAKEDNALTLLIRNTELDTLSLGSYILPVVRLNLNKTLIVHSNTHCLEPTNLQSSP